MLSHLGQELLAGLGRDPLGKHGAAHRRVGHRVEQGGPTLRGDVGGHGLAGRLGQAVRDVLGQPLARYRGAGRQAQGPHHPTVLEGVVEVVAPRSLLLAGAPLEHLAELRRHVSGLLLASDVLGADHHRPEIGQGDVLDVGEGGVGPVEPLGQADPGQEALGDGQDGGGGGLGPAFLASGGVLLLERRAHCREPTPQRLLGDHLLLPGQLGEQGVAMDVARPELLGLGPDRGLRPRWPGVVAPALGAGRLGAGGRGPGTARARRPILGAGTPPGGPSSVVPRTSGRPLVVGPVLTAVGGHRRLLASGAQQLQTLRCLALAPGRKDRGDGDAFEVDVGLGPDHVTHSGSTVQEAPVEHPLRLASARRTPGPGAVGAFAGELDLDPG